MFNPRVLKEQAAFYGAMSRELTKQAENLEAEMQKQAALQAYAAQMQLQKQAQPAQADAQQKALEAIYAGLARPANKSALMTALSDPRVQAALAGGAMGGAGGYLLAPEGFNPLLGAGIGAAGGAGLGSGAAHLLLQQAAKNARTQGLIDQALLNTDSSSTNQSLGPGPWPSPDPLNISHRSGL